MRFSGWLVSVCWLVMFPASLVQAEAPEKPNIILFLVDDMGWMDSSVYGSKYYETPNMERLAQRAVRFTNAYATPLCSPTRASILTGKYSARHGITSATGHLPPQPEGASIFAATAPANRPMIYPESRNYLRPSEHTLAEALRDAGYRTGHFGKWHLGLTEPYWPERQGFDVAFHGKPDPGPPSYFSPYRFRRNQTFPDGPKGEYITDRLTAEAVNFIDSNKDRPFFLNLWHYGVHGPWGHKEEYTKEFAKKSDPRGLQGNPIMASMLRSVDESLGTILNQLDKLQLTNKTIIIFMSDNGGNVHSNTPVDRKRANVKPGHPQFAMMENWRKWAGDRPPTNNSPLRDGKGRLYEGGIRVPLMIHWPGVAKGNTTSDEVVGAIDLYPTVLEMIGQKPSTDQPIDGVSLAKVLRGTGKLEPRSYFTWFPHIVPGVAVRQGDWKLIRRFEPTEQYRDGLELFHLSEDPGETKNLAGVMPDKAKELNSAIDKFVKETGVLLPKPNPAYRQDGKDSASAGKGPRGSAANSIAGWVPRGCTATVRDGALVVEEQTANAFLGTAGLKLAGPVELVLRTRNTAGAARIQWRTADQEQFPEQGQVAEFAVRSDAGAEETRVQLPVQGQLAHIRLVLPRQSAPVEILSVELKPGQGDSRKWDFTSPSVNSTTRKK